ncbi:hypothetical protein [Deinococcus navajonensis]|uniref:BON domain-containing protein n=1 Tax=Deinococcus navajonensis TaxID=309884 RepID=A0ABV8XIY3_9DEIO
MTQQRAAPDRLTDGWAITSSGDLVCANFKQTLKLVMTWQEARALTGDVSYSSTNLAYQGRNEEAEDVVYVRGPVSDADIRTLAHQLASQYGVSTSIKRVGLQDVYVYRTTPKEVPGV